MLSLYTTGRNLRESLLNAEGGQGLVEFALIIVVISLVALAASRPLTEGLTNVFSVIRDRLGSY